MALIMLIVVSLSLILVAFITDYWRSKQREKQVLHSLQQSDSQLKRSTEIENELQEEIGSLQHRLGELLHDPVTSLPGWQLFNDRVRQSILECERYHLIMGVVYVDIDDFKVVNTALGHALSDVFLCEVTKRLQTCIRQVDTLSRQDKDVFVILLARLAKPETAVVVAQRILQELAQPFQIEDHELGVTANIGLALYPTDGLDADSLLSRAEQALQFAKNKGHNSFQFYQHELQQQAQRELAIYSNFSRDTLCHEFKLYYQPIVDTQNETVICVDTIVHWYHPDVGVLTTQDIFAYAEKQGKLAAVTEWLVLTACKQFIAWRAAGFTPKLLGLPIAIKSLENGHFAQRLAQILKELNLDPASLLIEIPENFYHSSFGILEKSFNMLHYLKVQIALDHFGAGSLALRYLKAFPFNYFKLEQSLVDDIVENERTRQLIRSVLALAKNMSVHVVAQGVENQEQARILKELGCELIEGPVLGQPIADEKVIEEMA